MQVTTIEGIVKDGRIHLSEDVKLPEAATVYVLIVPNSENKMASVMSPRPGNKANAKRFVKTIEAGTDGEIR